VVENLKFKELILNEIKNFPTDEHRDVLLEIFEKLIVDHKVKVIQLEITSSDSKAKRFHTNYGFEQCSNTYYVKRLV